MKETMSNKNKSWAERMIGKHSKKLELVRTIGSMMAAIISLLIFFKGLWDCTMRGQNYV